ncbi:Cation/H+ exchanger [Phycomyces nitens]|nr:Cation/H+ exchanger [Phycomyces nitens]
MQDPVSVIAATFGGLMLVYALFSLLLKDRLYISEPLVALAGGILLGPACLGFLNFQELSNSSDFTREFTRVVIAIQVMSAGVSLPKAYLRTELRSLLVLLLPVMMWMWLISGLCVWYIIPNLSFLEALIIASCFTPTDPVLASSIVQGRFAETHVPENIRHILLAESGANDGLGYPFLFLAIYLVQMSIGPAMQKWTFFVLGYQILFSVVLGFVAGYLARKGLQFAESKKLVNKESFLLFSVSLALFLMGTVAMIGSDDLLACFIAGNAFTWDDWFRVETKNSSFMEILDLILNLSIFGYIGATVPWGSFTNPALGLSFASLFILAVLVLALRRLPIIMALYRWVPAINTWREAMFMGWFGPMGVGALFYYAETIRHISPQGPTAAAYLVIEPIIYFMVLSSVIVHGGTVPFFSLGSYATRTIMPTFGVIEDTKNDDITGTRVPSYGSITIV